MNVLVPLGTRPEIIKLAPVVAALRARGFDVEVVLTGQHYDPAMTDAMFDDVDLLPDDRWLLEGTESERTAAILVGALDRLGDGGVDVVLLLGDTNTVPLFSLAARRHRVPVVHLEAGLRSFNATSLEEVNRRVAGALASLHLAPTELAARFLRHEGVDGKRIEVVGNPIIDSLVRLGTAPVPISDRAGVVFTAHRATNVDDDDRLCTLASLVRDLAARVGPVRFPVHPRTRARLTATGLDARLRHPDVELLEPAPWREMIRLVASAKVVVTDSGGLQEEASWFGVPVVVLRRSTPRWEGVELGTSRLVGLDATRALDAAAGFTTPDEQARVAAVPCPYGDGRTGERTADLLASPRASLLGLEEPDFVDARLPW